MEAADGFYNASVWDRDVSDLAPFYRIDMSIRPFTLQNGGGVIVGTIDNGNNGYTKCIKVGSVNITVHDYENLFVANYDANNNFVWVETARKSTGEVVTVDTNGTVYISGYLKGNAPFGYSINEWRQWNGNYTSLSQTGNWLWAKLANQNSNSDSTAGQMEVNSVTNELYICGYTPAQAYIDSETIPIGGYVGKLFTSNGSVAALKSIGGESARAFAYSDRECKLSIGPNSSIVVGGVFMNDFTLDGIFFDHSQSWDMFLLTLHSNLSLDWHYTLTSSGHSHSAYIYLRGMDVDAFGNIYAAVKQGNTQIGGFSVPWANIAYGTIIRVNASTQEVDWADWPGHITTSSGYTYSTGDLRSITISPNGYIAVIGTISSSGEYTFGNITKQFGTNDQGSFFGVLDNNHNWIHIQSPVTYDTNSFTRFEFDGAEAWLTGLPNGLTSLVFDEDYDGIFSPFDNCIPSSQQWNSTYASDQDRDGCHDILEDDDDDGDGVLDIIDNCLSGRINWNSNAVYDRDGDGCADTTGPGFSQEIFPLSNYSNDDESMVTIVDFEPSPLGGAFVVGIFQDGAMFGDLLLGSQCYEFRSGYCPTNTAPFIARVDSNGIWEWAISIISLVVVLQNRLQLIHMVMHT